MARASTLNRLRVCKHPLSAAMRVRFRSDLNAAFKPNALDQRTSLQKSQETDVKKYKRIEITAFRRRVTITSGEINPAFSVKPTLPVDEGLLLNDADSGETITPESAEGQAIIAEAVRSLERRLSLEAGGTTHDGLDISYQNRSRRNGFYLRLQSFYQLICPKALRSTRKEK